MLKLHLAVFLFGLAGLFGKLLDLPPTAIVLGRTALGAVTLVAILQAVRAPPQAARASILRVLPSGLLLAVHWVTFFRAIQVSSVAVGLLSYATFPIFVVLLDALLSRSRLLVRDLLLAAAVFVGLALVVPKYDLGDRTAQGALWGLASGLTFALLTIWNRRLVSGTPAVVVALWQNAWAAAVLLPFGAPLLHLSLSQALLLGLLGVFCTAVAHWLFIDALKTVRVQVASVTAGLEPVYGILLALIVLKELPGPRVLCGGAIILLAVTVAAWYERPAPTG